MSLYVCVRNLICFFSQIPYPIHISIHRDLYWSHMSIWIHYNDVIMIVIASQITSVSIVWSTVCSGADQRKHQSSATLAFVRGIHRWPVDSPHKRPVTQKMFPFHDVIILGQISLGNVLFPHYIKPLPEPTLTNHQWDRAIFISGQFHKSHTSHHSANLLENYSFKISHISPRSQAVGS